MLKHVDHSEYSQYTHGEIWSKVTPYCSSKVDYVPLNVLDTPEFSMMKFRSEVGSYFHQELAMFIDKIISKGNYTKLYYYAGDRIPCIEQPEYSNLIAWTVYFKPN